MNAMEIDKKGTALVVIDLQKGIAAIDRKTEPHSVNEVVDNAARLADAFRRNGMPVFLVHVVPSGAERLNPIADEQPWRGGGDVPRDFSDFVEKLGPRESDVVIAKRQWGAFYGTDLELQLRRRGIHTIVLCGIATNYGVESTARFAYEYGYQQVFVEDATAAMSEGEHRNSVERVFKRIGRVRKTDEIIESL